MGGDRKNGCGRKDGGPTVIAVELRGPFDVLFNTSAMSEWLVPKDGGYPNDI